MLRLRRKALALTAFWIVLGVVYVWTGWQQKDRLNLSAAAGGQMPYLTYAEGVARDGWFGHFGDRNRMPLIPSLLSYFHDDDWDVFVARASTFAIVSSAFVLVGVGFLCYHILPAWPATVLTLTAVVCVFPYQASFVQAELAYYGLLFAMWVMMCRLLYRPDWRTALLCGLLLALTYLTKASALGALVAFLFAAVCRFLYSWRAGAVAGDAGAQMLRLARIGMRDAGIVCVVFLLLASPYLAANKTHFGRFFYNVNSTFFMWCDSWAQAKAFGDKYDVASRYPQAPPDRIPGPLNYWRTHTLGQMGRRLAYGIRTLAGLAVHGTYAKYLATLAGLCLVLAVRQRQRFLSMLEGRGFAVLFSFLFLAGYVVSYAWYVTVAFGDRFVLSLVLPVMCGLLWLAVRLGRDTKPVSLAGRTVPFFDVVCGVLVILLLIDGGYVVAGAASRPTREFVQFYYNESRELQKAGNLPEAVKGFRGVIRLDPGFAPAYHDLGIIALVSGETETAVEWLAKAAALAPDKADVHNSCGSALLQGGRPEEALAEFHFAVRLDPRLAPAWYNLGGTYHVLGRKKDAIDVLQRLRRLDTQMAEQLAALIEP